MRKRGFRSEYLTIVAAIYGSLSSLPTWASPDDFVTTETPMVLLSVNDGELTQWPPQSLEEPLADSFTVIHLYRDRQPKSRTIAAGVWGTIAGSPRAAIIGRFGFVTNHEYRPWDPDMPKSMTGPNQIAVVDLDDTTPKIVQTLRLQHQPRLAIAHPDGRRLVVAAATHWYVFAFDPAQGVLTELTRTPVSGAVYSFELASDGETILAAVTDGPDNGANPASIVRFNLAADSSVTRSLTINADGFIVDAPFSPAINASVTRAYVLNGWGFTDGVPDDILVVDLETNKVIDSLTVCDGIESFAIHPSTEFGVAACLNDFGPVWSSHLAIVDLTTSRAEVVSYTPVEHIPEGMEFSPDGEKLFVGATQANHIAVYEVESRHLHRSDFVLLTGYGPSALGSSPR